MSYARKTPSFPLCQRGIKGVWFVCLLPLVLLFNSPAHATVEGSPHDLVAQGYDVVKGSLLQERCSRCHLSSSSSPQDYFTAVPPVLAQAYSASSVTCFSCHDGTTIVSPDVDASRTAFHPSSHGLDPAGYEGVLGGVDGLPYVEGKRLECLSCHDPHENNHRPFLREDLQKLCLSCHVLNTEFGRGKENLTGNHILGVDPEETPRAEVPLKIADAFRTPYPLPYPLERGKGGGAWHWNLGGHLSRGGSGDVGCGTCHAVHGGEQKAPVGKLLAVDPVAEVANLFCEGCHAGERGDGNTAPPRPNPGGTTAGRTYHPVDDDRANGDGRSLEIREPPEWPFGGGTPRRLICTTCHAPHNAWVRTPLLRAPPPATGFCETCHDRVPDNHHLAGFVPKTNCGSQLPTPLYGAAGGLVCASCHRAHNAGLGQKRENDHVPLLIKSAATGELCENCHPAGNPTCGTDPERLSTHFTGDSSLRESYLNDQPPLRVESWPESGLTSVYAGNGKTVACLSCHSFRAGALVSGDDGTSRYLLARSGNGRDWKPGDEATYLCTGCHGTRPGTGSGGKGHTHPLMDADIASLGSEPIAPLSATAAGKVNCDSCHRVHNARTRGGRYILEVVNGANTDPLAIHPKIDFTALCQGCHSAVRY